MGGWSYSAGSAFGTLSYESGLVACNETAGGDWGVFALLPTGTLPGDCLGFDALTSNETEPAAWEYE